MTAVQQGASIHEKTVQAVATGEVEQQTRRGRGPDRQPRTTRVETRQLHPLLKAMVKHRKAEPNQIEYLRDGGIIIHNNSNWKK